MSLRPIDWHGSVSVSPVPLGRDDSSSAKCEQEGDQSAQDNLVINLLVVELKT